MKFYGKVGYAVQEETSQDVWEEKITEHTYKGDIIGNSKQTVSGENINNNVNVNNQISIVADPFAYEHFFGIRYIEWMGSLWTVTSVKIQRPRLILTIGGLYNGTKKA